MRCSHCGAALGPDPAWCGVCARVVAAVSAPPAPAAPPGYPVAGAAPPSGYAGAGHPPPPGYAAAPPGPQPYSYPPGYPAAPHVPYGYATAPPGYVPPGYPPAGPPPPPPGWGQVPPGPQPPQAAPYGGYPGAAPPHPYPGHPAHPAHPTHRMWPTGAPMPQQPLRPPVPQQPPPHRRAGWTTFAAIAVGALMSVAFALFARDGDNEALVRYSLVAGVAVYGIVAYLVVSRVKSDDHPLAWRGSWRYGPSIALGVAVGGTLAGLLTALSVWAGGQAGDAWVSILVSEGTMPHIATAFLLVCVAAPVVEEVLFRGLLLESWLPHGRRLAVWSSGLAFSVWHLSWRGLVYYTLAGALLGALYLRKGLACSIAAHTAFNGVLLVGSVAHAFAPGPVVQHNGLTLQAPRGWHTRDNGMYGWLYGPSAAEVVITSIDGTYAGVEPAELVARLQLGTMPELAAVETRADTARTVDLPAGEAVRVKVVADGRTGELVLLPDDERLHVVVLSSGGSTRARGDFDEMLGSVRVD